MNRAEKRRQEKLAKKQANKRANKRANNQAFTHSDAEERAIDVALEHHQAGRLAEAEAMYRKVLSTNPNHPMALHYLGLVAHQMGDADVAVELIGRAVAVLPDYVEAYANLANMLVQLERGVEAEAACRHALVQEPNRARTHYHLAKALELQDRPAEALESYRRTVALDPQAAHAHSDLGRSLNALGQFGEALESFQKAVALDPASALFHNNLGSALHMLKRFDAALEAFTKALSLDAGDPMAQQNMANVLRDMGRVDEAVACLETLLAAHPDLASARHNLNALKGHTPDAAPAQYVEELFDHFAHRFDGELQDKLQYAVPTLLKKRVLEVAASQAPFGTVVDLGCGTGLVGEAFRDVVGTLIGVDLSKNMVREAQRKGVYDQLLIDDLVDGLGQVEGPVDLFVCADVFIYVGALDRTFGAVKEKARPGSLLVFSTEHTDATDTFVLQDTSRYAHAKAYIEAQAQAHGFEVVHFETIDLRKEKDGWIPGAVYMLKA